MIIADCFKAAVAVAEQNCYKWIFLSTGALFDTEELRAIAREFDEKTPLEEEDFLAVTEDGSIGLLFPGCKEPDWYFVSPEFALVNVLQEDINDYIVPAGDGVAATGGASGYTTEKGVVFCQQCGAQIKADSKFCMHCGAKNTPGFCSNCGAKLEAGSQFCGNCGTKV